jgi:signal transduction histidine kinase
MGNRSEEKTLHWRFDVNTFRLLGRDLITDRITAVFELVKNCYDANAQNVNVIFSDVSEKNPSSKILIKDDGHGMTFDDINNKWMVIGTASKRQEKYSPPPYQRRYVGEKGVGRFAVDKLGGRLLIKTKKEGETRRLNVEINWEKYENLAKGTQLTLFTDVDNIYYFEDAPSEEHGTTLEITAVNEVWTKKDTDRLYKELSKIVSPFHQLTPPFKIFLSSQEHDYKNKLVRSDAINYATYHLSIGYNKSKDQQEVLKFNDTTGEIDKIYKPVEIFGAIKMIIYHFNEEAKRKFNQVYKGDDTKIDGIKIYRDGIVTTPFAEFEANRDKKRDILGIDKRLWRDIFNRVATREIIGVLDITKEDNPDIIDATNRQDFVENAAYHRLKEFIIEQLDELSKKKQFDRAHRKVSTSVALQRAGKDVKQFSNSIKELKTERPDLEEILSPLQSQAEAVQDSITKGLREFNLAEKEFERKENIYLSLMSLQQYAIHIAHSVRTSLGKIKRMAEFFKENFPNAQFDDAFKQYSISIYDEMNKLNRVIDFMLSYAESNLRFEDVDLKKMLEELFYKDYAPVFESEKIQATIELNKNITIHANKKILEDIFSNLISNSIKAISGKKDRIIKCSAEIGADEIILYFSDNGIGIDNNDKEKIFDLYFTKTAEQGGAGVGLYVVKMRIEALQGKIEVVENEFKPTGATFKITLPFKK